jgi:hypothetical protein
MTSQLPSKSESPCLLHQPEQMEAALIIILVIGSTVGGGAITNNKGRGWGVGIALGFFLGVIGLIITLFLSNKRESAEEQAALAQAHQQAQMYRECPHCREQMRRDASVCSHCRSKAPAWKLQGDVWWFQSAGGSWYYLDEAANEWRAGADQQPVARAQAATTAMPIPGSSELSS